MTTNTNKAPNTRCYMGLPVYEEKPSQPAEEEDPITSEKKRLYQAIKHIKHRVGVHSGKGGVGKTFIASQLALLLASEGYKTGLLDADVDCPNAASAFNLEADMSITESGKLIPVTYQQVKVSSTAFLTDEESIIIRGPIKHRLLTDFIERVEWGDLDALIFDFPPGTSDVPLSAMQVANLTGIILVTTPHKESLKDVKRAAHMARRVGTKILGLVENMSGEIFGEGRGEQLAQELEIPFLTSIPLSKKTRQQAEQGKLTIQEHKEAFLNLF